MKAAKTSPPSAAPPAPAQLLADADAVNGFLDNLFGEPDEAGQLARAMHFAVMAGGKRIRAGLVMGAARLAGSRLAGSRLAGGDNGAGTIRVAAAFECLHAYSLIHDDLPAMDDAAMRRGKPSCHAAFGEATAILAGDGLQSLAFELLADPATHENGEVRASLVLELARAAGAAGMAGGQMLDLEAEKKDFDMAQTSEMQSMKTGALITAALRCGGIIGGSGHSGGGGGGDNRLDGSRLDGSRLDGSRLMAGLDGYGKNIGLAFQIADDVLDREGQTADTGKPVGRDSAAGKASLTGHLGIDGARDEAMGLAGEAVAALRDGLGDNPASNPHLDYMMELAEFIARRGH